MSVFYLPTWNNFLSVLILDIHGVNTEYSFTFSGVMLGISNMVSVVPGFISPIIVGVLTYQNVSNY